jgi:asparagine synthase (glutamine-hydrolysing)
MIGWASELKSLVPEFTVQKRDQHRCLKLYLHLTYIPAPYCIYKNVFKLEPGCYKQVDTETLASHTVRYWDVKLNEQKMITDYGAAKNELRNLLFDSVEKRMIADVPLGVFLSGGIDSTIVRQLWLKFLISR